MFNYAKQGNKFDKYLQKDYQKMTSVKLQFLPHV